MLPTSQQFERAAINLQWLNHVNEYPSLAPIFTTENATRELKIDILQKFSSGGTSDKPDKHVGKFSPARYRTMRFDGKTRQMEFPHPVPYFWLVNTLVNNWDKVSSTMSEQCSRIGPKNYYLKHGGRIVVFGSDYSEEEIRPFRLQGGSNVANRDLINASLTDGVVVKLDISNFFPSIYTHALDWSIQGERTGRLDTPGAKIDKAFSNARTGRTDGVSIGPVTSNIAAEIILFALDKKLQEWQENEDLYYSRAIDDLTLVVPKYTNIDDLVNRIAGYLSSVGLALNHAKTKTYPYKLHNANHISYLVHEAISPLESYCTRPQIRKSFGQLYLLADESASLSIVKYGWKKIRDIVLRNSKAAPQNVDEFLSNSWALTSNYPHMIPEVVAETIIRSSNKAVGIPPQDFVENLLDSLLPRGFTDVSTWLLYYFLHRGIPPEGVLEKLHFFDDSFDSQRIRNQWLDSFVALSLLAFEDHRITARVGEIFSTAPQPENEREDLWSEFWPIRYELYRRGILKLTENCYKQEAKAFGVLRDHQFILMDAQSDFASELLKFRSQSRKRH